MADSFGVPLIIVGKTTVAVGTARREWHLTVEDRRPATSAVLGASVSLQLSQGIAA